MVKKLLFVMLILSGIVYGASVKLCRTADICIKEAAKTHDKFEAAAYLVRASNLVREACYKGKSDCKQIRKTYVMEMTLLQSGKVRLKNFSKAYKNGCESGAGFACYLMGTLYMQGLKLNGEKLPKNTKKAMEYFKKGCKFGDKKSCTIYYERKYVITKNDKFISKLEGLCKNHYPNACIRLSSLYLNFKKNNKKAKEYLKFSCEKLKDAKSCSLVAALYLKEKNEAEGKKYIKKACNLGDTDACSILKK